MRGQTWGRPTLSYVALFHRHYHPCETRAGRHHTAAESTAAPRCRRHVAQAHARTRTALICGPHLPLLIAASPPPPLETRLKCFFFINTVGNVFFYVSNYLCGHQRLRHHGEARGRGTHTRDMGACFGVAGRALVEEKLGKPNAVLVDARPSQAFEQGHVEGAINVPVGGPMGGAKADAAVAAAASSLPQDKSTPIVTYCDMGGEASACKKALERAGYTDVTNGGSKSALKRWKEAMQTSANVPSRGLLEADLSSMQAQSASRGMLEADLSSMQGQVPPPKQALSSV